LLKLTYFHLFTCLIWINENCINSKHCFEICYTIRVSRIQFTIFPFFWCTICNKWIKWTRSWVYSIYCGNESASSSVMNIHNYIIIRKLQVSIFNMLTIFISRWEIHTYREFFFYKVGYTKYYLFWFLGRKTTKYQSGWSVLWPGLMLETSSLGLCVKLKSKLHLFTNPVYVQNFVHGITYRSHYNTDYVWNTFCMVVRKYKENYLHLSKV
jgi:hypothetical protein